MIQVGLSRSRIIFLIVTILISAPIFSEVHTIETIPNIYKADQICYVSDPDNIITESDKLRINDLLKTLEDTTTIEVAVTAVNSIGEIEPRSFAWELFNHWKIGKEGKDNGLLLLLVIDQRMVVFETGYGLEEWLPDVVCYNIQQKYMVPLLKEDNFSNAMVSGVEAVCERLTLLESGYEYEDQYLYAEPAEIAENETTGDSSSAFFAIIFFSLFTLLVFIAYTSNIKGYKNKTEYKNGAEKLVYSDRRISFGKIGCMSIFNPVATLLALLWYYLVYRQKLKTESKTCPQCRLSSFKRLEKSESINLLNEAEQFEEKIGSVDFYIYRCEACKHIHKIAVPDDSKYEACPRCNTRAYKVVKEETIKKATYTSQGEKETTNLCIKCYHTAKASHATPMLTRSSSSGSSSSGSRSRSSSSSSSRGGGRSGGGGASSRF